MQNNNKNIVDITIKILYYIFNNKNIVELKKKEGIKNVKHLYQHMGQLQRERRGRRRMGNTSNGRGRIRRKNGSNSGTDARQPIGEMENIEELNDFLNELDALEEWEQKEIAAAIEAFGYDFEEAMDKQQRGYFTFYEGMDLEEVAEMIIDECYFTKDTPNIFTRYFDYAAFARDLGFDGYTETAHGVIVE